MEKRVQEEKVENMERDLRKKNRKAPQKGNLVSVNNFVGSVSLSCVLTYRDPGI